MKGLVKRDGAAGGKVRATLGRSGFIIRGPRLIVWGCIAKCDDDRIGAQIEQA